MPQANDILYAATVDLKGFLRAHGFRFKADGDRGQVWTNGIHTVHVRRSYDKEPGQLVRLIDEVKAAENRKRLQKEAEAAAANKPRVIVRRAPTTPEEHREAQIASVQTLHETSEPEPPKPEPKRDFSLLDEVKQRETAKQQPEPTPVKESPDYRSAFPGSQSETEDAEEQEESKVNVKRKKAAKYSGEERLYVFGRLRFMYESNVKARDAYNQLRREGVKSPTGKKIKLHLAEGTYTRWRKNPALMQSYEPISKPRIFGGVAPQPKNCPTAAADCAAVNARLPAFVLAILREPTLSAEKKVAMVLAWAEEGA